MTEIEINMSQKHTLEARSRNSYSATSSLYSSLSEKE